MRSFDLSHVRWRKSSRSNGGGGGACVEVADLTDRVAMRDSKNLGGPVLVFAPAEWRAFVGSIRSGELD